MQLLQRLQRLIDWDIPLLLAFANRAWSLLSGPVTVFLVPTYLSSEEQGLFYTFSSILSAQMLFELGLNQCVMTSISHETAHLNVDKEGILRGDMARLARLGGILKFAIIWYTAIAIIYLIAVGVSGLFILQKLPMEMWLFPWVVLVLCTALNLLLTPFWLLMEGARELEALGSVRLLCNVLSTLCLWTLLVCGKGLSAPAGSAVAAVLCGAAFVVVTKFKKMRHYVKSSYAEDFDWKTEILPQQWRIAITWISSYLIFNVMTSICYYFSGAAEAGRLGISVQVGMAVHLFAIIWLTRQSPVFAGMSSSGDREALRVLFKKSLRRSVATACLGGVSLVVFIELLKTYHALGNRFGSVWVISILSMALALNQIVQGIGIYFRSQKKEPLLGLAVVNAGIAFVGMPIGASSAGAIGVSLVFLITQILSVIWCSIKFKQWDKGNTSFSLC